MKYEIAGQDVASFIKEHDLSRKYKIHQDDNIPKDNKIPQDELKHMESGYVDAALIMKFLKVAVGEKDKFTTEARAEIEKKFEPTLEKLEKIKSEVLEIFINSGILSKVLGDDISNLPKITDIIIQGDQKLREVGKALKEKTINEKEAERLTSVILRESAMPPSSNIKQIIEIGKLPNRGGRGELGS